MKLYALAIQERKLAQDRCEDIQNSLEQVHLELNTLRAGAFMPGNQSFYLAEINRLRGVLEEAKKNLSKKQEVEDIKRQAYLKAKSEKDIIEKLKAKKRTQHFKEQIKLEQKMLDELISSRMNFKI